MATQIKQTPENRNAKRRSVSISGPAYMVAVGGAPRGSKAKTRKYTITISKETIGEECRITSRYLRPSSGSCHDLCKHGVKGESLELKEPATRFGSRKMSVMKNKGVGRTVVPDEPSLPLKNIGISKRSLSTNRKSTQNEVKLTKNHVKEKSISSSTHNSSARLNGQTKGKEIKKIEVRRILRKSTSVERVTPKVNQTGSLLRNHKLASPLKDQNKMTKNKLKQLIAEKVPEMKEMTMHEAKTAELDFAPLTVTTESTDIPCSESSRSSSDTQDLDEDHEEVILSEVDYEMVTSEWNSNYRVVICEDEENGELEVKFRRGKVVEVQSEDDDHTKLKFRRGKVLEDDCKDGSETVNLKHQEMQERKEAQELLNRVIEETASKLVVDKKTKVGALVGAFESIINLQDDLLLTSS